MVDICPKVVLSNWNLQKLKAQHSMVQYIHLKKIKQRTKIARKLLILRQVLIKVKCNIKIIRRNLTLRRWKKKQEN